MIFVIQRFYKGLLGDEGYLMHTLPVGPGQLVLSKLICAVVTSVVSMAVMFAACLLMVPIRWGQVLRIAFFQDLWQGLMANPNAMVYLLEFLLVCALSLILFITMTYLSMAIGHLFRRRIIMSVVAFIGLDILGTVYLDFLDRLKILGYVLNADTHATFLAFSHDGASDSAVHRRYHLDSRPPSEPGVKERVWIPGLSFPWPLPG